MTKDPFSIDRLIGNRIRVMQEFRKFTVGQTADQLGISERLLQDKERGKERFSAEEIVALAKIFQFQPSSLFKNLTNGEFILPLKTCGNPISLLDYKTTRSKLSSSRKSPSKNLGHF